MSSQSTSEGDGVFIERLVEMAKVLESLTDDQWSRIEQAIETSKFAYGADANLYSVMRLVNDAVRPMPEGWSGSTFLYMLGDADSTDEELRRIGASEIREKLNHIWDRHEIWLRHLLRIWGKELNWYSVDGAYLHLNGNVLLRLTIERNDRSAFVLEMPPGSTVRLTTAILETVIEQLPPELLEVDEDDMDQLTQAVHNISTEVARTKEAQAGSTEPGSTGQAGRV